MTADTKDVQDRKLNESSGYSVLSLLPYFVLQPPVFSIVSTAMASCCDHLTPPVSARQAAGRCHLQDTAISELICLC